MSEWGRTVLACSAVAAIMAFMAWGLVATLRREAEEARRICDAYYALSRTPTDSLRAASRVVHGRPCAYYLEP